MSTQTMIMITAVIAVIALILGAIALAKVNKKEGYAELTCCQKCMQQALDASGGDQNRLQRAQEDCPSRCGVELC